MQAMNASRKLRIGLAVWGPLMNPCSNGNPPTLQRTQACPEPGLSTEILHYLLLMSGLDYEIHTYPVDVDWGRDHSTPQQPCNWTGVLGDIYHGRIDTLASEWMIIDQRLPCFDYLYPTIFPSVASVCPSEGVSRRRSVPRRG